MRGASPVRVRDPRSALRCEARPVAANASINELIVQIPLRSARQRTAMGKGGAEDHGAGRGQKELRLAYHGQKFSFLASCRLRRARVPHPLIAGFGWGNLLSLALVFGCQVSVLLDKNQASGAFLRGACPLGATGKIFGWLEM